MPYNPYYPYPQPPYQQPNFYQSQQPPQTNQYAFVNGIEGAKSFSVQPNQTVLLMDSDEPIVYMKSANSLGQATIRYFRLMEASEEEIRKKPEPSPEYATKSELKELSDKVDGLLRRE